MYVTGDTIIRFATVLGALGTLGALLYRSFRWMEQQKAQQAEIENIKKEQCGYMLRAFGNTGRAQAAWRKRQCQ